MTRFILLFLGKMSSTNAVFSMYENNHNGSCINPSPAEFLKWNNPCSIIGTAHDHSKGYQDENLKWFSQHVQSLVRLHGCAG